MAIPQIETHQEETHSSILLDSLYCEEEQWDEELERENLNLSLPPLFLQEQDMVSEEEDEEELLSLFTKEKQTHFGLDQSSLHLGRDEAVDWMLKVNTRYGFSPLTAVLAINYLDRFIHGVHFENDKPWMIQLAAVTCLSLAAKVEETHVPLLLDLQVEETRFVFEAKTIQKMELLVLSTLQWRMNPVTPFSFLDHIVRRLGSEKTHLRSEFHRRSESLLLTVLADSRFARYLPSVLATATMLHIINELEPCNAGDYHNQLLCFLKISKEEVEDCYKLISTKSNTRKRKYEEIAGNPNGLFMKKMKQEEKNAAQFQQQHMRRLSSLSRVFVDAVCSPL